MNEVYLGSRSDQRYVQTYLSSIRRLDPIEIVTVERPIRLDKLSSKHGVHPAFFQHLVKSSLKRFSKDYGIHICPLSHRRYYVGLPTAAELGGFHDDRSTGYQYWFRAGFVMMLGNGISHKVRTFELARSYLHDCLHAETFVSFRRVLRTPAPTAVQGKRRTPEVYREQYGINFRNQNGLSYSAVSLTDTVPEAINLNLLMDGVVAIAVADVLAHAAHVDPRNRKERKVLDEILFQSSGTGISPKAKEYHRAVILPTRLFIDRWGGKEFTRLMLRAMVSGDLRHLKSYFDAVTGTPNAWEKRFKRPEFSLSTIRSMREEARGKKS